jgi:hypothetical protein
MYILFVCSENIDSYYLCVTCYFVYTIDYSKWVELGKRFGLADTELRDCVTKREHEYVERAQHAQTREEKRRKEKNARLPWKQDVRQRSKHFNERNREEGETGGNGT